MDKKLNRGHMQLFFLLKGSFLIQNSQMLDLKVKVSAFSYFSPEQTLHGKKNLSITKSAGVNVSFSKFIEKSIIGKLLFSCLKEVSSLILLTR